MQKYSLWISFDTGNAINQYESEYKSDKRRATIEFNINCINEENVML